MTASEALGCAFLAGRLEGGDDPAKAMNYQKMSWLCYDDSGSNRGTIIVAGAITFILYGIGIPVSMSTLLFRDNIRRRVTKDQLLRAEGVGDMLKLDPLCHKIRLRYGS
eukprot:7185656-Ditylum_brightwellii.AAC.1